MNLKRKDEELAFNAILAKNDLARMVRDGEATGELGTVKMSTGNVMVCLRQIEKFLAVTGLDNQPCVDDIMDSHFRL